MDLIYRHVNTGKRLRQDQAMYLNVKHTFHTESDHNRCICQVQYIL